MKKWMHKAEKIVDDAIPVLLFLFVLVVALEIFFPEEAEPLQNHIDIFDTLVIGVFIADLFFKYQRIRNFPKFVKKYWLEIFAIVPFYLVFRLFEYLQLVQFAERGTKFINETRFMRGPALMIREAQKAEGLSRTAKLLQFKPLVRLTRLLAAIPFFEKPTGGHHLGKKKIKRVPKSAHA